MRATIIVAAVIICYPSFVFAKEPPKLFDPTVAVMELQKRMAVADRSCINKLVAAKSEPDKKKLDKKKLAALKFCREEYIAVQKLATETRDKTSGNHKIFARGYERAAAIYVETMQMFTGCYSLREDVAKYHQEECIGQAAEHSAVGERIEKFVDDLADEYILKK